MKKQLIAITIGCLVAGAVSADTLFTGAIDSDFTTAGNWDNGVVSSTSGDGTINGGFTSNFSTSYYASGTAELNVGAGGSAGTLNVNSGEYRNGNAVNVGVGSGAVGTVNIANGATLTLGGDAADLFVGDLAGGYGIVNVNSGGTLNAIKAVEILNGQLVFESGAVGIPGFKDECVVDNNGVLVFQTDGSTIATLHATTDAKPRILELGSTSTLDMQLGGTYSIGDSWVVIDNILTFSGVSGGDGDGTFGNVTNSINPDDAFAVHYGNGLAAAGEVVVQFVGFAVPVTTFNDSSADGTWANAANWSDGVPDTATIAVVNSNLTANLSGGAGAALRIGVGTVVGMSGTVTNGTLTVDEATFIGTAANATGMVNVATYAGGASVASAVKIGVADGASGSLVAGSGSSLAASVLSMATAPDSVGVIDLTGVFSLSSGGDLVIGSGSDAQGTVTADSGTLNSASLALASGSNAVATLDIASGSIASSAGVSIAAGQDSDGTLTASTLTLTGGAALEVATGIDSTATVTLASPIVLASTNGIFVGTGLGSATHNLVAADFAISDPMGDFAIGPNTGSSVEGLLNAHDSYGTLEFNAPFSITAKDHQISRLTVNDTVAVLGGTAALLDGARIDVASVEGATASLDLADWMDVGTTSGVINVATGDHAVGSITGTDLIAGGEINVGTGGDGSAGTLTLDSLAGGEVLDICDSGAAATGTVTVVGDVAAESVKVGRGLSAVATLNVGGSLSVGGAFFNAALGSNSISVISSDTLYKTNNLGGSVKVAGGNDSDGRITADAGSLVADVLEVSLGARSVGLFAVTNGTLTVNTVNIATGDDSDGTVLVAITSSATNAVNIGTGSNAVGTLTLQGGTLTATDLTLGGAGTGAGTIELAGGDLVATGAVNTVNSSFIDVVDDASTFTWTGKVEADFIALWDAGTLRSNGESGLTSATFSDYFSVAGDVLSPNAIKVIGEIAITGPLAGGGLVISWDTALGQDYNVETNGNLIIPGWGVYDSVVGDGGGMSVTSATDQASLFYKVTTP